METPSGRENWTETRPLSGTGDAEDAWRTVGDGSPVREHHRHSPGRMNRFALRFPQGLLHAEKNYIPVLGGAIRPKIGINSHLDLEIIGYRAAIRPRQNERKTGLAAKRDSVLIPR